MRKHLTLTQLSVITGILASLVTVAATTFVITGGILLGSSSVRGVTGAIVDGIFRIYARFDSTGRTAMGRVSEHAEVKNGGTCDTPQIMFTVTAKRA